MNNNAPLSTILNSIRHAQREHRQEVAERVEKAVNGYLKTIEQKSLHQKTSLLAWLENLLASFDLRIVDKTTGESLSIAAEPVAGDGNPSQFVLRLDADNASRILRRSDRMPLLTLIPIERKAGRTQDR